MLSEMTPEQFQRWRVALVEVGSITGWDQAGTIAAAVVNAIREVAFSWGGQSMPKSAYQEPKDFVPVFSHEHKEAARPGDPMAFLKHMTGGK